jgi:alkyl hydroperoxide reductase subunit AhpC
MKLTALSPHSDCIVMDHLLGLSLQYGLSVDAVSDHEPWLADIKDATGGDVTYPIIGDYHLKVAKLYDMLAR